MLAWNYKTFWSPPSYMINTWQTVFLSSLTQSSIGVNLLLVLGGLPQVHDSTVTGLSCSREGQNRVRSLQDQNTASPILRAEDQLADCRRRDLHFAKGTAKVRRCSPFVWEVNTTGEQWEPRTNRTRPRSVSKRILAGCYGAEYRTPKNKTRLLDDSLNIRLTLWRAEVLLVLWEDIAVIGGGSPGYWGHSVGHVVSLAFKDK